MADNKANFNLVPTKLNRPAIDSRWISRPRLLSVLDDAMNRKLTLISAPAGYGKTTLAAQWLDHIAQPSAWLSLDEHDSDPERFLRYVTASIRKIFPQFGPQIGPLLSSPTLPPLEYLTDALISDLTEQVKPWVLVFDDFHSIGSRPVQEMLSRLLQYLPDLLHLVIATRVDPWLPLANWRAREWLTEIRADHLRFYTEETQDYLGTAFKGRLSAEAIERINVRTEGWVTGLQLTRLSLTETDDPEAFAWRFVGSDRIVLEYLMDEVGSGQPDEIKHFFAMTSLLERFCAPLCDHILGKEIGIQESRRRIALLEQKNLFIVPLDSDGIWYRYHHLFHALLRARFKAILPQSRQAEIHHRAGEWFASHGYIEDGLRHLIAAGDLDAAAELVAENMHAAIDKDLSRRTMGRWLDLFPKGSEKRRPALLVAHSFQRLFNWDLAGMIPLLDRAESLIEDPSCSTPETRTQSLLGDIAVQRAVCLTFQPDVQNGLHHALKSLLLVPKNHRYVHTTAIVYAAACKFFCGKKDDALLMLDKALIDDCADGSLNSGHLLVTKAVISSYEANWDVVEVSAKSILEIHKTISQADYWLGYTYYFLGCAAYERNQLDSASEYFSIIEKMRYLVTTRLYHDALIGQAFVAMAEADAERVKKYSTAAYSFAIETKDPLSKQISDWFEVRQAISSGQLLADKTRNKLTDDSTRYWLLYPSLTQAEYMVHKGDLSGCSEALDYIEKGLQMARHHHNTRQELQFLAVKAVALKCAGKRDQALALLEKTLSRAEPHGLVRLFVDRGPMMAELLVALSEKRSEDVYLKVLLDAFKDKIPFKPSTANAAGNSSRTEPATETSLSSGLTNREHDILILLGKRLSNKEIAQQLYISPITVKTHTVNIYRKLNVHKRRQAVVRAIQLGLLNE